MSGDNDIVARQKHEHVPAQKGGPRAPDSVRMGGEDERREAFDEWRSLVDLIPKMQQRKALLQRRHGFRER